VEALRQEESEDWCWQRFGQHIEDSKILPQNLQFSDVRHVRREANRTSHRLAKNELISMEDTIWMRNYLSFIQSIVLAEQDFLLDMEYKIIFSKKRKKKKKEEVGYPTTNSVRYVY